MILYKYKSLQNLWHVLDITHNQRIYCAHWKELNDPLEGKYEIYLGNQSEELKSKIESTIELQRDALRIASFSTDPTNFLMWSHYADGHKGCVIEVEIDDDDPSLQEVYYHPFSSVIQSEEETEMTMFHLFNSKNEEWKYENEYRVITEQEFFKLDKQVIRVLLGPLVDKSQETLIRKTLPSSIDLIRTELNKSQGALEIICPKK